MTYAVATWVLLAVAAWDATPPLRLEIPGPEEQHVSVTATRCSICLNGLWRFAPAEGDASAVPAGAWGHLPVPGSWAARWSTAVRPGEGYRPDFRELARTPMAFLAREVELPGDLEGKQVLLELKEIGRWAKVFVDGRPAGLLRHRGSVDLTPYARGGGRLQVAVLVSARETDDVAPAFQSDGSAARDRGLTGDTFLHILPAGELVESVAIRTSVRRGAWEVIAELAGLQPGQEYRLSVTAADAADAADDTADDTADGAAARMEKRFVAASAVEQVAIDADWPQPRHWEPSDPHLYSATVQLHAVGGTLRDERREEFGFREFGIDGGDFVLNGRKIRLRPMLVWGTWERMRNMNPLMLRAQIAGLQAEGFNTLQFWPSGFWQSLEHLAQECDRAGMLLILPLESMTDRTEAFLSGPVDEAWKDEVARQVAVVRNHPSLIMYGVSPNRFGTPRWPLFSEDQPPEYAYLTRGRRAAKLALAAHHALDPTRPVFFHASDVGDFTTVNMYLNMMPIQEQKEFLSYWAAHRSRPLMAIECGLPFFPTVCRWKRVGYAWDRGTPLATEYAAIYLGSQAYDLEQDDYVRQTAAMFQGNETYRSFHNGQEPNRSPQFLPVMAEIVRQRWRSWRTWGISGGMLPWEYDRLAHHKGETFGMPVSGQPVPLGPRALPGIWPDFLYEGHLVPWTVQEDAAGPRFASGWTPAGQTLREVNGPVLTYIGGPGEDHCDAGHNFYAGEPVRRDVIAIHDGDRPGMLRLSVAWEASLGDRRLANSATELAVPPGEDVRWPIEFPLPQTSERQEGVIRLRIDGRLVDEYWFTVFPAARAPRDDERRSEAARAGELYLYDPLQVTSAALARLNIATAPWEGKWQAGDVLIVGRQALSDGRTAGVDFVQAVADGLRVILMLQDVAFWEQRMGWRTSWHVSRCFFKLPIDGGALEGLRDRDFANWRVAGTLLSARPEYRAEDVASFPPPQPVWRWGNSHAVATVALEKPHYGSFTPLLEGEFDLAYSPLLELQYGQGRVLICQLNIEENAGIDPAADAALAAQLEASRRAVDQAKLLRFDGTNADQCRQHLDDGHNVLVTWQADEQQLARAGKALGLDLQTATAPLRGGSNLPAWPELRGVSRGELRWRGFLEVPLIRSIDSGEVAADGLLARARVGQGTVVFCQVHPDMFPLPAQRPELQRPELAAGADSAASGETYFRLSRWRAARLLSQLETNLGREPHPVDTAFLQALSDPPVNPAALDLASSDQWLGRFDPDNDGERRGLFRADTDRGEWKTQPVPHDLPSAGRQAERLWLQPGSLWLRREFSLPPDQAGQPATLVLRLDGEEAAFVWINGQELVRCDEPREGLGRIREYYLPPNLLAEQNVLTIRVQNFFGQGGLPRGPLRLEFRPPSPAYHPDHDADDNPFRWYPW